MTDRIRHLTVILDRDIRDDDLEPILTAINLIKGVAEVRTHVVTGGDAMAREIAKMDLKRDLDQRLRGFFYPEPIELGVDVKG